MTDQTPSPASVPPSPSVGEHERKMAELRKALTTVSIGPRLESALAHIFAYADELAGRLADAEETSRVALEEFDRVEAKWRSIREERDDWKRKAERLQSVFDESQRTCEAEVRLELLDARVRLLAYERVVEAAKAGLSAFDAAVGRYGDDDSVDFSARQFVDEIRAALDAIVPQPALSKTETTAQGQGEERKHLCVRCGSTDDVKPFIQAAFYGLPELQDKPVCYQCALESMAGRKQDVTVVTGGEGEDGT